MDVQELVRSKRDEILRLAARRGAFNVRVFGSVARGEADEQSDVDFLVDLEEGRNALAEFIIDELGLTDENVKEVQPWELCAQ